MNIKQMIANFLREEEGLTVVEYAVAGGLVTVLVAAMFTSLGEEVLEKITALRDAVAG